MELFRTEFGTIDWVIVVVYLAGSILIGLWANRYVGGLSDYLVAGRTLRIRLALATMTGTELGLVTVMYVAELGYTKQFASLYLAVIEVLALAVIGATGVVVYRLRQEAVLTVPEYYERRYTRTVRVVGAVMMVLAGVLNMGVFLKAGSQRYLSALLCLFAKNVIQRACIRRPVPVKLKISLVSTILMRLPSTPRCICAPTN